MRMTPQEALALAIQIVGGPSALAAEIGTTRQAVRQWNVCPEPRLEAVMRALERAKSRVRKAPTRKMLCPKI